MSIATFGWFWREGLLYFSHHLVELVVVHSAGAGSGLAVSSLVLSDLGVYYKDKQDVLFSKQSS